MLLSRATNSMYRDIPPEASRMKCLARGHYVILHGRNRTDNLLIGSLTAQPLSSQIIHHTLLTSCFFCCSVWIHGSVNHLRNVSYGCSLRHLQGHLFVCEVCSYINFSEYLVFIQYCLNPRLDNLILEMYHLGVF